jgi:four helix bundle protein
MFRFQAVPVYQEAKSCYRNVIDLANTFPREYWHLADQLRRSILSVVLNVAEGAGKRSNRDFNRFIQTALGSMNETVAALDLARDYKLLSDQTFGDLLRKANLITKQ